MPNNVSVYLCSKERVDVAVAALGSPAIGEDAPMTMQVGMIGSDGIVLASDTKWTVDAQRRCIDARYDFSGRKILTNESMTVAVACARDMAAAYRVASGILAASELEREQSPDVRLRRIWEIGIEKAQSPTPQCIVAFAYPEPSLFLFEYLDKDTPACIPVPTYVHGGDTINAAAFWTMHYYKWIPVAHLKRLAAHMIVSAHELNSQGISGLEIICCNGAEFHRLTDKENRDFEEQARGWDKHVGQVILGYD